MRKLSVHGAVSETTIDANLILNISIETWALEDLSATPLKPPVMANEMFSRPSSNPVTRTISAIPEAIFYYLANCRV